MLSISKAKCVVSCIKITCNQFLHCCRVEFFGVKLNGFHFTEHGWVQSYGSRYVRPPIIYGDVEFTEAMTVKEFKYAQSLTQKPVKGMLTGEHLSKLYLLVLAG